MRILALDSSGLVATVAIIEDEQTLAEYTVNYKKTHSQTLLPMLDEEGNVQTAHSTNVVPMIMIGTEGKDLVAEGKLADIAPTLLELLGLEKPEAMSGTSMLK